MYKESMKQGMKQGSIELGVLTLSGGPGSDKIKVSFSSLLGHLRMKNAREREA